MLSEINSKNLGIPEKIFKDYYFHLSNNLLKMPFSIFFSTFCEPIQKVRTKAWFLTLIHAAKGPKVMQYHARNNLLMTMANIFSDFSKDCILGWSDF